MESSHPGIAVLAHHPKDKARQGYSSLDAVDPRDGTHWKVLLSHQRQDWVRSQGIGRLREMAYTVTETLTNPNKVYVGVRSEDVNGQESTNDWLCYVAIPSRRFLHPSGAEVPAPPGRLFLVFVTSELVVYTWYWAETDPENPAFVLDADERFGCLVL
jgi:hypothetical protein